MISAKIIRDSRSPEGVRLTTFEVEFPRFILAEVNTHRVLSRNSASSRAIPTEKIVERVLADPFVPDFNKRVKGMGVGDPLNERDAKAARKSWLLARDDAVKAAKTLMRLDVDKSRVNRLLEPFMWHTAIITATEWSNFLALRTDRGAQPEFRLLALLMQDCLEKFEPYGLQWGEWHLPYINVTESVMRRPTLTCMTGS
jgi:thymidylate synthase ThyX